METKPHLATERLPHRRKSEIALIQSHGLSIIKLNDGLTISRYGH